MTRELTDREIAESIALQAKLIAEAYATCDDHKIEQALITVSDARRMLKNGILDLIDSVVDNDN